MKSKFANCLVNAESLQEYNILDTEGNVIAIGRPLTVRDKLVLSACSDDDRIYESLKRGLVSWEVSDKVNDESIDQFSIVAPEELINIINQIVNHNKMVVEVVEFEEKN